MKSRRAVALTATAALAFGGAGAAVASGSATSGAAQPSVQVDSVGCVETAALGGKHLKGSCTYVLTDGRRFRCPLSFSNHHQTPTSLERAPACITLTPILIPQAWRPVLARMYAAQACFGRRGIRADGGPLFEPHRPRDTPIAELVVLTRKPPPTLIGFYISARAARRAEPKVITNVQGTGGQVERRGSVTVVWTKPPPARLKAATDACVFG